MRLFPKLLLAFFAVVLLAMLIVGGLANRAALREVSGYMVAGGMASEERLAAELAGYYHGTGSWQGVEALFGPAGMGHMMGQRFIVADTRGQVAVDTAGQLVGQTLAAETLADGVPIEVEGRRVGTLLASGGMMGVGGPSTPVRDQERALLARVNRSIWLAALVAGLAALVAGGLLAYGLVRPIRALTQATAAVARGQLSQRVAVGSHDELGELGAAFNSMAASLERAERLRREMTADIAHELRNPIAVLQGNLEAVIDGVLPPTPDNLQPLLEQTQLLTRLVDDMRTLALADAGQLSLERAPTDPGALAQTAAAQFQPQAEARQVRLTAEVAPGLPSVPLDPQRIAQVVGNLLSNALRHTPAGGSVVVRVARDAGPAAGATRGAAREPARLVFSVSDTGPGIPPEALPHIFERFYRADSGRARSDGGTGLGLTIARKLVEAHGGEVFARNLPGQGAEVGFVLPVGG